MTALIPYDENGARWNSEVQHQLGMVRFLVEAGSAVLTLTEEEKLRLFGKQGRTRMELMRRFLIPTDANGAPLNSAIPRDAAGDAGNSTRRRTDWTYCKVNHKAVMAWLKEQDTAINHAREVNSVARAAQGMQDVATAAKISAEAGIVTDPQDLYELFVKEPLQLSEQNLEWFERRKADQKLLAKLEDEEDEQ